MTDVYSFERRGRTKLAAMVVSGIYAFLALAFFVLEISLWISGIAFLLTLPALWDMIADTRSGFSLSEDGVTWFHGKNSATIERSEIKLFKVDLRMDRSVKLSVELHSGRKIRLPQPSTPPLKDLERELANYGFPFRKNPFALL